MLAFKSGLEELWGSVIPRFDSHPRAFRVGAGGPGALEDGDVQFRLGEQ